MVDSGWLDSEAQSRVAGTAYYDNLRYTQSMGELYGVSPFALVDSEDKSSIDYINNLFYSLGINSGSGGSTQTQSDGTQSWLGSFVSWLSSGVSAVGDFFSSVGKAIGGFFTGILDLVKTEFYKQNPFMVLMQYGYHDENTVVVENEQGNNNQGNPKTATQLSNLSTTTSGALLVYNKNLYFLYMAVGETPTVNGLSSFGKGLGIAGLAIDGLAIYTDGEANGYGWHHTAEAGTSIGLFAVGVYCPPVAIVGGIGYMGANFYTQYTYGMSAWNYWINY